MQKLYFYPSAKKKGYSNPYSENYKAAVSKYFEIVDKVGMQAGVSFCLFCNSFVADIFVLNWIESVASHRLGVAQYWIVRLCFKIIKLRKKKIVWMLHNIHPHKGSDKYSESIMSYLFKNADLIISHSTTALDFARNRAKGRVEYICHPVAFITLKEEYKGEVSACDVLIWGDILPYKGIVEFISNEQIRESNINILIIGRCSDHSVCKTINSLCSSNIHFENRRASYEELKVLMDKSKYVLFPYLVGSVSSSGSLIDTIMLGGTPVGPNIGAFKDLSEEDVCLIYNSIEELMNIFSASISINKKKREDFVSYNTWDVFAMKLNDLIKGNEYIK